MFGSLAGWLLSLVLAFFAGASIGSGSERAADSELQQKVQDHMDVIVDETAGIIDDVTEEVRNNEHVQEAEQFVEDVKEIARNTADDIDAHFGKQDVAEEAVTEALTEAASEAD
ncbi:MAG: hypothetical protein J6S83_06690 [Lachnospiraceae bacterium]|nr:hypothetical protein [Lachnospiraceae bacterium]